MRLKGWIKHPLLPSDPFLDSRESIKLDERIRSQNFCRLAGSASCGQTGACPDLNHSYCPCYCSILLCIASSHAVYLRSFILVSVLVKLDVTSYRELCPSTRTIDKVSTTTLLNKSCTSSSSEACFADLAVPYLM